MTLQDFQTLLKDYSNENKTDSYIKSFKNIVYQIASATNKDKDYTNKWLWSKKANYLDQVIYDLDRIGLELDGKHITLTVRGITYDYIAYTIKLKKLFPNAAIDVELFFEGDTFEIQKESGKVVYTHKIADPFTYNRTKLKGAYCVLRVPNIGEYHITMSIEDLKVHENLSNMKYLYDKWWRELYKKTVIRKCLKVHFEQEFEELNDIDNESMGYELEKKQPYKHRNLSIEAIKELFKRAKDSKECHSIWAECTEAQQIDLQETFKTSLNGL